MQRPILLLSLITVMSILASSDAKAMGIADKQQELLFNWAYELWMERGDNNQLQHDVQRLWPLPTDVDEAVWMAATSTQLPASQPSPLHQRYGAIMQALVGRAWCEEEHFAQRLTLLGKRPVQPSTASTAGAKIQTSPLWAWQGTPLIPVARNGGSTSVVSLPSHQLRPSKGAAQHGIRGPNR